MDPPDDHEIAKTLKNYRKRRFQEIGDFPVFSELQNEPFSFTTPHSDRFFFGALYGGVLQPPPKFKNTRLFEHLGFGAQVAWIWHQNVCVA
jgi:hypothetical protein